METMACKRVRFQVLVADNSECWSVVVRLRFLLKLVWRMNRILVNDPNLAPLSVTSLKKYEHVTMTMTEGPGRTQWWNRLDSNMNVLDLFTATYQGLEKCFGCWRIQGLFCFHNPKDVTFREMQYDEVTCRNTRCFGRHAIVFAQADFDRGRHELSFEDV